MRKITSLTNKKRDRTNQLILGIGLAGLMLLSILGYSFKAGESEEKGNQINYLGFTFTESSGLWILDMGNFRFVFRNNPKEVPKIGGEINYINSYAGEPLYLSSTSAEASAEIYSNMNQIVQRMQLACLNEACGEDLPIKTCEDNFIIIESGEEKSIVQQDGCVFISGPEENLTSVVDEFLLKALGIE